MRMINVDDETISLLEGAAVALEAALAARAARVDPEGILSRSFEMSRIKTGEAIRQFRRPPPRDWSTYTISERAWVIELCRLMLSDDDDAKKSLVLRKLRTACFRYDDETEASALRAYAAAGSIRDITMAADAATAAVGTSSMRKKVRKDSDRAPSPKKAR